MKAWVKSWLEQTRAMWWLWQSQPRELLGGDEKGTNIERIWDITYCWRSLRKRWRIMVMTSSSICVHFYNAPFISWCGIIRVLGLYSQKSQKRCWHDTYLLMKIEWPIGKMMMGLNFSSWVGCCSNWYHGFGRNKLAIALQDGINFLQDVGPLFYSSES